MRPERAFPRLKLDGTTCWSRPLFVETPMRRHHMNLARRYAREALYQWRRRNRNEARSIMRRAFYHREIAVGGL